MSTVFTVFLDKKKYFYNLFLQILAGLGIRSFALTMSEFPTLNFRNFNDAKGFEL